MVKQDKAIQIKNLNQNIRLLFEGLNKEDKDDSDHSIHRMNMHYIGKALQIISDLLDKETHAPNN